MRNFTWMALAGMLAVAMVAAPALAQDAAGGPPRKRRGMGPGGKGDGPGRMMRALDLTEEQATQVKQIMDTHHQALENWRSENGAKAKSAHEKLREARKSGDEEAVAAARKEMEAVMSSRKELHEDLMKQLGEVLTEEQMGKAKRIFGAMHRNRRPHRPKALAIAALRRLDLSPEQKARVKEILAAAKSETPEQKREIMQAAAETIRTTVLTEKQREKLEKMREAYRRRHRPGRALEALGLTDEQKEKVKAILSQAKKDAQSAETPEQKMEILRAARKTIHEDVLTDEQRENAGKFRERRSRGPRRGPRHGGKRPAESTKD